MNERLIQPEQSPENFEAKTNEHEHVERKNESTEIVEAKHDVVELSQDAAEKAVSAKEVTIGERQESSKQSPALVQHELKADAFNRTLKKVRGHLNPVDRAFSKVIHQPAIDAVSELGSKTIARPSGILGGGLLALSGSGILLYISKHYGFEYNFTVFLILFAAGFVAGLFAELVLRLAKR